MTQLLCVCEPQYFLHLLVQLPLPSFSLILIVMLWKKDSLMGKVIFFIHSTIVFKHLLCTNSLLKE